ncbi:uncharacterized protein with FMN-binding domain [Microbacteriaceae bacterium MWH-Ta3]|nr:uncharacterized protein with FMN-binding domain [Microbacteriaceae bacterium MWH-Ta3]
MRTPSAFVTGAATAAIVAIGWNVGQAALTADAQATVTTAAESTDTADSTNTTADTSNADVSASDSSASSSSASASETTTSTTSNAIEGTYVGDTYQTRWGPMQVQVVISGGAITAVETLQYPANDGKSVEINQRAVPILLAEVLEAQSASVTNVSRATYSSEAYKNSVQSALDAAGFTG